MQNTPKYQVGKSGEFVIENFQAAPTFASFFPGIAGPFGTPMWVFYTNRGQAITSAGVEDKNGAIIEFHSANKAFHLVALQGFRTFIKIDGQYYEPFREASSNHQEMRVRPDCLTIVEENHALKLLIEVTYFTLPHEPFPALVRQVKIINHSSRVRKIELLDGLPALIPYGFDDSLLKKISTTTEAWCTVENLANNAPFYKLKVRPADIAETQVLKKGNFFLASCEQAPVSYIVDPTIIFGTNSSFQQPTGFLAAAKFQLPKKQLTDGFTPAAFAFVSLKLKGKSEAKLSSLLGQAENVEQLNQLREKTTPSNYLSEKFQENRDLIANLCAHIATDSADRRFDLYCQTTFLDNVMRGGFPQTIGNKVVYLYYRKHGDMERDYNDFKLSPFYLSQGTGNYRDINQNRRNDLFFNPHLGDDNIQRFFNLIQLDGFNPLILLGSRYFLRSTGEAAALLNKHCRKHPAAISAMLQKPFYPGMLLKELEISGCKYKTSRSEFIEELLSKAQVLDEAIHGEGFWSDHFFYNTDLLESFENLFPDRLRALLFTENKFTYFDNDHIVAPRSEKYLLVGEAVRQYESVRLDMEKARLIGNRSMAKNAVRTKHGTGDIYYCPLSAKLLCLIANKAASFDAEGIGLEMEADKPDWYDALNGLPGLCGSSLSETLELKRLCLFLQKYLSAEQKLILPIEVLNFIEELKKIYNRDDDSFAFWDATCSAKEAFRQKTRLGVSGEEQEISGAAAIDFLNLVVDKCSQAKSKELDKYNNYYTYFVNDPVNFERIGNGRVRVTKFFQRPLPLFLEGFVHALKVEKDHSIPKKVKSSPLYDQKLKMYKVNAPLQQETVEIGRARIFTPGWLENESIWLHMEYKYLLELLKAGLYDVFFQELKNTLVPFMDPQKYGRSILENSSFIVSSANPNQQNHGRGFVARLSGGAAEFIEMWLIMMTGEKIFALDNNGKLTFSLAPILPNWLFKNGRISFKLLGNTWVTYVNPKNKSTFSGIKPVAYLLSLSDGKEVIIKNHSVPEPYASLIRAGKVAKLTVTLG